MIRENVVRGSGRADLALGAPAGEDNQFEANEFMTSLPSAIQDDASEGDDHVSEIFQEQQRRAENENYPSGNWRDQPEPRDQPTMRDPEAPPRPASKSISWGQW
ncbi:hypothetical protein [Natrinema sp. SYSU A 869]|uniref:hypothetical protein n=1 Tax=Natrinema sp. SYSU A 869 TaxID=2871694 RepID=UPI001CA39C8C|nr:hypothetical protein [Natrinema sp. SYSU A 869]